MDAVRSASTFDAPPFGPSADTSERGHVTDLSHRAVIVDIKFMSVTTPADDAATDDPEGARPAHSQRDPSYRSAAGSALHPRASSFVPTDPRSLQTPTNTYAQRWAWSS